MIQTEEQYEFVHHALCLYESRLAEGPGQWAFKTGGFNIFYQLYLERLSLKRSLVGKREDSKREDGSLWIWAERRWLQVLWKSHLLTLLSEVQSANVTVITCYSYCNLLLAFSVFVSHTFCCPQMGFSFTRYRFLMQNIQYRDHLCINELLFIYIFINWAFQIQNQV